MSSSKSWGDLLDIKYVGLYCLIILRPNACPGDEINLSAEQFFQLVSQVNEFDANRLAKIHYNINITFRRKIGSDDRTEQANGIDVILLK